MDNHGGGQPEAGNWIDAERLRALLTLRGMTLGDLARRLDVTPQAVQKWVRRDTNPRRGTVERIAAAVRVLPVDLTAHGRPLEVIAQEEEVQRTEREQPALAPVTGALRTAAAVVAFWGDVPTQRGELRFRGVTMTVPAWLADGMARPIIVRLTDSSCEPTLHVGDFLLVDPDRSWTADRFHLFAVDGVEVVRRVGVRANMLDWTEPDGRQEQLTMNRVELRGVVVRRFNWDDVS